MSTKKPKIDEAKKLRLKEEKAKRSFAAKKQKEAEAEKKALQRLATSKVKNPKDCIKEILSGKTANLPGSSPLHNLSRQFLYGGKNKHVEEVLFHCFDQDCDFFHHKSLGNIIKGIAEWKTFWMRPLEDWKPQSYNGNKQISSLLRHLFAKYPIPTFMDDAFLQNNSIHQEWFLHVGEGNNIRTASKMPIPLTRKAAHLMMQAPNDFNIYAAIRWGQLHAMGGNERTVRAVVGSRLINDFNHNEFWESVFRWFIDNPMLDTNQYGPLIDYIYNQKFVTVWINGAWVAPQPNMSMKHRSVDATIKGMEEWHKQSGRNRANGEKNWNASGFPRFDYKEGNGNNYSITELLSTKALQSEGRYMHHCVGSYSSSCATGRTSIWSMERNGESILTIQVDNPAKSISQARGKYNAKPSPKEQDIMRRWMGMSGLTASRWAY